MSLELTFWEDPRDKDDPDDFDGILTVRLKTVKQIPGLLAAMPKRCTMVSLERSAPVLKKDKSGLANPNNPRHFREIWRAGQPIPNANKPAHCPFCNAIIFRGKWSETDNKQAIARLTNRGKLTNA